MAGSNGYAIPDWLEEYESRLYTSFEERTQLCLEKKNFSLALQYLNEIQTHCMTSSKYACPDDFYKWMGAAREGFYIQLLEPGFPSN